MEEATYPVGGIYCRGSSQILHDETVGTENCVPQVEQMARSRESVMVTFF